MLDRDIIKLLKSLVALITNTINKVIKYGKNDTLFSRIIEHYFKILGNDIGEMTGAMSKSEFYAIFSSLDNISIRHTRKIFNAFWVLCKVVVPFLIYYGTNDKCDEMLLDIFIQNIHNGIAYFSSFMKDFVLINEMLLENILLEGLCRIRDGDDPDRKITINHFYRHVIKMMYIGTQYKSRKERQKLISGYNYKFMNTVSIILDYLTPQKKTNVTTTNVSVDRQIYICPKIFFVLS